MRATVVQVAQPQGLAGARFTGRKVAELVAKHRDDPRIEAQVSKWLMRQCPELHPRDMDPQAQIQRARCIDRAFRQPAELGGIGWQPDPLGREKVMAPYLLVNGIEEPLYDAADCANVTGAWLAAFLNFLGAAAIPSAIVIHGYNPALPHVTHMLAAVAIDPTWREKYYVDRSQDLPFGTCTPFDWEVLIDPLTGETICDAAVCLGPDGLTQSEAGRVSGSSGSVSTMNIVSGLSNTTGAAPSVADLQAWKEILLSAASELRDASKELLLNLDIAAKLTAEGTAIPGWTPELAQKAGTALGAAELVAPWLVEAATGKRKLILAEDGSGWGLEELEGDKVVIRGAGQAFWLETRGGLQLGPPITIPTNVVGVLEGLPVIVVAGVLVGVQLAVIATQAFLIYQALTLLTTVSEGVREVAVVKEYGKCLQGATAEECTKWLREQREIQNAKNAGEGKKNDPFLAAIGFGEAVLGAGAIVGIALGAKYVYEEIKSVRPRRKAA